MCESQGQLAGIGSLLSRESWGHNTSYQTCGQVLSPAEPYLLLSLTVHVCGWVCARGCRRPWRPEVLDPLELEVLTAVKPPVWGLGTELGSPGVALITELSLQSCWCILDRHKFGGYFLPDSACLFIVLKVFSLKYVIYFIFNCVHVCRCVHMSVAAHRGQERGFLELEF